MANARNMEKKKSEKYQNLEQLLDSCDAQLERKTKIICTIRDSNTSFDTDQLKMLMCQGMNVARVKIHANDQDEVEQTILNFLEARSSFPEGSPSHNC